MGPADIQALTLEGSREGTGGILKTSEAPRSYIPLWKTSDCVFNCFDYLVYFGKIENGNVTRSELTVKWSSIAAV